MTISALMNVDRTTIVAGEAIDVNFVGTTSTATSKPFHHLFYLIDWGDPGNLDNNAFGPVVSHIYRDPGTYTINARIFHINGDTEDVSQVITVQDPDVVYAGTDTISVANTASDFVGAASGSNQQTVDTWAGVVALMDRGKRVELRAGDTFTTTTGASYSPVAGSGVCLLTRFGVGANPTVDVTATPGGAVNAFTISDTGYFAGRDVDFIYSGGVHTQPLAPIQTDHRVDYVSLVDMSADGYSIGFAASASGPEFYTEADHEHVAIHRCDSLNVDTGGAWIVNFAGGNHFSYVACDLGVADESLLRITSGNYLCLDGNTFGACGASQNQLKAHARSYSTAADISRYWNIFRNHYKATTAPWQSTIGPQNGSYDERVQDVICDGNYYDCSTSQDTNVVFGVTDATVRNEIWDGKTKTGYLTGAFVGQRGIEPAPTGYEQYHCVAYGSGAGIQAQLLSIGTYGAGTAVCKNGIVDCVNYSTVQVSDGAPTAAGNFIGDALFTAPASQDFSLQGGSSARDNGDNTAPVMSSYNGHLRKTSPSSPDSGAEEDNVVYPDITGGAPIGGVTLSRGASRDWLLWPRDSEDAASDVFITGTYTDPTVVRGVWRGIDHATGADLPGVTGGEVRIYPGDMSFRMEPSTVPMYIDSGTPKWMAFEIDLYDATGTIVQDYAPVLASRLRFAVSVNILVGGQSNGHLWQTSLSGGLPNVATHPMGDMDQDTPGWKEPSGDGRIKLGQALVNTLDLPNGCLLAAVGATACSPKADLASGALGWHLDFREPKGPLDGIIDQRRRSLFANGDTTVFDDTLSDVPSRCEGIIWWQGEAEALAVGATGQTETSLNGMREYKNFLEQILPRLRDLHESWNGKPPVAVCLLATNRQKLFVDVIFTVSAYQGGMAYDAVREAQLQFCAENDWAIPIFTADSTMESDGVHVSATSHQDVADRIVNGFRNYWAGGSRGWEASVPGAPVGTSGPYISSAYQVDATTVRCKVVHDVGTSLVIPATAENAFVVHQPNADADISSIPVTQVTDVGGELELTLQSALYAPLFEVEYAGHADLDPVDFITDDQGYHLQHTFGASQSKNTTINQDTGGGNESYRAGNLAGCQHLPGSLSGPSNAYGLTVKSIAGTTGVTAVFTTLAAQVVAGMKFSIWRWTSPGVGSYIGTGTIKSRSGNTLTLSKSFATATGDDFTFDYAVASSAGLVPGFIPKNQSESGSSIIGIGMRGHSSAPRPVVIKNRKGV